MQSFLLLLLRKPQKLIRAHHFLFIQTQNNNKVSAPLGFKTGIKLYVFIVTAFFSHD